MKYILPFGIASLLISVGINCGVGIAQTPGTGPTNPTPPIKKPSVERTVMRLLTIPPQQGDVWSINRNGQVSFDVLTTEINPSAAQCKGGGVKFAQCVKGIVDKSGCAKVTPCDGTYCGDPCSK